MDSTVFHSSTPAQEKPLATWRAGFLAALRETGNASSAARYCGIDRTTAYKASERDPSFAQEWEQAIIEAGEALEAEARRRAMGEYISYKFDKSGRPLMHPLTGEPYAERAVSDTLLVLLLKAAFPDKYKERSVVETPPTEQKYDLSLLTPDQLNLLESITRAALPPSLDSIVAQQCRNSFYRFFLEMWETIEAVELVPNWHIEYLCNQLQEVYEAWECKQAQPDMLINVPPGTSKSTTVTQLFPAWLWLKRPSIRIISSSYAAGLSVAHAIKSRDCVTSPKFRRLFPGHIEAKDDQDGKTDYRNTAGGQRFSASTGGAVTGNHADFIILDDPIKPDEASSEAGLKAAKKHMETLATRKTDKARSVTITVMQRLNELDPAGVLLASGMPLRHICLPGELTTDQKTGEKGKQVRPAALRQFYVDDLLDARRLTRPVLRALALALGSYGYAGQVQQLPAPDEGGILKKAWFKTIGWPELLLKHPGAASGPWLFDADTAYTADQLNDPSALLASCYLGQTLYVRHATEMWLEMPELKKALPRLLDAHGYTRLSKLYVEPKASGKTVVQELRNLTELNVVEAPTPTGGKVERVNAASPFIEAGRVVLVDGAWNEAFINQCAAFPTAAHDDMLDCLTQAIARVHGPAPPQRARVRTFNAPARPLGRDYGG